MREEIVAAGFGGQGVMLIGKILAYAGMMEGKQVTYFPSYGAEVRGGTANSTTIISTAEIPTPISSHPDVLLAMNSPSCKKFGSRLKKGGLLIANTSLIIEEFIESGLKLSAALRDCYAISRTESREFSEFLGEGRFCLIENVFKRSDLTIMKIPATSLAHDLGNKRSANMIMIGAYLKYKAIVSLKSVEKAFSILLPGKKDLWDINKKALCLGMEYEGR